MGRPYKGLRVRVCTRLPADIHERAVLDAAERGIDMSTWLQWATVRALGINKTKEKAHDGSR